MLLLLLVLLYVWHNHASEIHVPTPTVPPNNAYDDFVKAGKMASGMKHQSPYSMATNPQLAETYANYAACAKEAEPILALLRQGLAKPYLHPPVRTAGEYVSPYNATLRGLARMVMSVAKYDVLSGKPARAADVLLDGIEMSVTLPRGGTFSAGLSAMACEAMCASPLEPLLPKLSEPELAHVAARLEQIQAKRVPYADILVEEGNSTTATLVESMKDPHARGMEGWKMWIRAGDEEEKPLTLKDRWQAFQYTLADKDVMIREGWDYMNALAEEAHKPYTGKSSVPPPKTVLGQIYYNDGICIKAWARFAAMETVTALLRVEVALYRYRAANGRFPATLSELAPTYLKTLPDDPLGQGKPLHYRLTNGGKTFLLYSPGVNLTDEGGTPQRFPGDKNGDMVAGQLWLRKPVTPTPKSSSR